MSAAEDEAPAVGRGRAPTPGDEHHRSADAAEELELSYPGPGLHLAVKGELDMASTQRLAAALDALLEMVTVHVTLDVSELSFIDCAGLTVLITAARELNARGSRLSLHRPRRAVWRLLAAAGADWLVDGTTGQAADEARATVGLSREELFWRFFALGGTATRTEFEFFLDGLSGQWDRLELMTLRQAFDERRVELRLPLAPGGEALEHDD